ncbi:MAG TPA: condensation domain-containing protein, partial [Thermoanaerobaculia bacterium]|nr:condensation domain-containing protein [Thermoanaerobaculia bacterium]
APEAAELRRHLAATLPDYMVPSAFVVLPEMPLSPNGKVDRKVLARIAPEAGGTEGYLAPCTPVEELLAGIWGELLGVDQVGVEDNFFLLGGHSLLATQLVSRIRGVFGVEVALRKVFEAPTVAGLALVIDDLRGAGRIQVDPIRPVPRTGDLPLSYGQERLWFLDRFEPGSSLYNMPAAVRLTGELDIRAFAAALGEIVRRHESLRTAFAETGERPVQRILPWEPFPLSMLDLAGLPEPGRKEVIRRLLRDEVALPFDLGAGLLLRATLGCLGSGEHLVVLTFHHIASDGWSVGVFLRELSELYAAFAAGRPSPLPDLAVQYADFAAWQREYLMGEGLEGQLAWWRERLAGAPAALDLPTDRPRPPVQRHQGGHVTVRYSGELAGALATLAREEGATLFMTLLAGVSTLLHRLSGQDDVLLGSPVANRTRVETEGLIGFFVNTVVLRSDLSGSPTLRKLLGRTREMALAAYAHQELPFERLVEELQPVRDLSRSPLFQVLLVLQTAPTVLELPGLRLDLLEVESGIAKFDLTFSLTETAGGLELSLEYDRDLFDAATVRRMSEHLRTLLEGLTGNPDLRLSELPLLTEAERIQLLEWNATAADYDLEASLHELIARQVERTPEAVAVCFEGAELAYGELWARAGRLAGRLRGQGVGPEVRVGISAERSLELVVGLLAILRIGGAYVPVDPGYPQERIAYLLEDSQVALLLDAEGLADGPGEAVAPVAVDPDNLAYVIYTSGSTGKPKGAMNTHRGIVNRLLWMQERYGLTADD